MVYFSLSVYSRTCLGSYLDEAVTSFIQPHPVTVSPLSVFYIESWEGLACEARCMYVLFRRQNSVLRI